MTDEQFLTRALEIAAQNVNQNGGPFGAVIVKDGQIIAEGVNQVSLHNDPTAHAEMQAIRVACKKLDTFDLTGCEIYSSCEPCPMCFSSIYWAHLDKVYYAANHIDAKSAGFDDAFIYDEIRLQVNERSIPFVEFSHENKNQPFKKWLESDNKIKY
jgi:tRNA(Arg) A34 adenosine deaminase TadA